ncbi:MAG: OmpH family outer membrane protein [Ignavibacteriales bacterium]|jgi:Outer membrane protein|nr:MAG: OmpH family outer membrane protein [Ignavibacteriaceae bacterium]MBW7872167.1 OmpH family outer membrane protein [Ignavibacteria bacterium]MCZ2142249.1 OmpH family outer membrane protein [Ignavibacteriales bacterium]OQY74728.1 MAG: molecular chaperone Skp [Ignavibacteriales bacterium UTCHB3]MBV6445688.1 hypothetical protein [Ignavibacteriaceae bacterium]
MKIKFFIFIILFSATGLFAQLKVGYIDSDAIIKNIPDGEDAKRQLDALIADWQGDISRMESEIKSKKDDLERRKLILTDQMKFDLEEEIKQLERDLQAYRDRKFGVGGELFVKQEEIMKPVQNKVFNAIQQVAKDEDLDFVFDRSSALMIVFAKDQYDITAKVLEKLK